ncbi:MAG: alkaline phosphatase family protein [Trueperaceae bacterium]|nr:alkaline phosphatase family protein [Trueperaceae bacterium]
MPPVIVIMLDGVSADHRATHAARVPHLAALAAGGFQVDRVRPDLPATSLPGRTSILTGVAADLHGVYGNFIWDGERFRYANPDDVRVPTLPRLGLDAGLDVAVLGYGMVRPEDATVFHHAWWANEMLQRARDAEPIPADEGWLRTSRHRDGTGRLAALAAAGLPDGVPDAYAGDRTHYFLSELAGDQTMLQWTAALACGEAPPDLLFTEVLTPDTVMHLAGHESPFSHWAITFADGLVGNLLAALERAGRRDSTTIVVTSDHGHGPVARALYPRELLSDRAVATEGAVLYVAVDGERDAASVAARLAAVGVIRLADDAHLPDDRRGVLATFVAPPGAAFEHRPAEVPAGTTSGPARYRSSHGFAPGTASDDRFLIVTGPGVRPHRRASAGSADVAATVAALAGIELATAGTPLI